MLSSIIRLRTVVYVSDVVMRYSDGEGRSSAPTVHIAAEEVDFSGAVEHVLDSRPVFEARNVSKAYGFEAKAALRKATGRQ